MKNKDLIRALLDFPLDSEVYVAGFDGATGERNWDGGVETLRSDGQDNIYVEFNELFLDNHEEERNITPCGGYMVRADRLREGDVINAEPIFDYYERNGMEVDEAGRRSAEAERAVGEWATDTGQGSASVMVTGSNFYCVPKRTGMAATDGLPAHLADGSSSLRHCWSCSPECAGRSTS